MIVLLTSARKNVGDFLIADRARKLLEHFAPDEEIVELPSWQPLEPHLDLVRDAGAVVIPGGPGYQPGTYPRVYPLLKDPAALAELPLGYIGGGWFGKLGDGLEVSRFKFERRTQTLLERLGRSGRLATREELSHGVLEGCGVPNVMTGCPVWYDLPSVGKILDPPDLISTIVFTPPERDMFMAQSLDVLAAVRERYPQARIICSFHRGLSADEHTTEAKARTLADYAAAASRCGVENVDTAYGVDRIAFYAECDMHVGYRVHAHLDFLSRRQPSLLLEEDSRGRAFTQTLHSPGVSAYRITLRGRAYRRFRVRGIHKRLAGALGREVGPSRVALKVASADVVRRTQEAMAEMDRTGYSACATACARIDRRFPAMRDFVRGLLGDVARATSASRPVATPRGASAAPPEE